MRYNFGIFCPFLASLCATSKAFNIDGSKNVWDFREKATNEHKVVEDVTGGLFGTSVVTTDLISVVGAPGDLIFAVFDAAITTRSNSSKIYFRLLARRRRSNRSRVRISPSEKGCI